MARKRTLKKSESLRDRAAKASQVKTPKRRVRKAASAAGRPIGKLVTASRREYHLITPREKGVAGFLTKPRKVFPRYFINSWRELRQVSWPNRRTTWKLVFAVFAFATVFGVAIALVDYGLESVFKRIILRS